MAKIIVIATHADEYPRWAQKTEIGGSLYKFYFSWNERIGIWQMSISDAADNLLLGGLRLVPKIDLLAKYRATVAGLPKGMLRILDKQNDPTTAELDRDNFGSRFVLSYSDYGGGA